MLDLFPGDEEALQPLLYIEESIPVFELFEVQKSDITAEDAMQIAGIECNGHITRYSHVVRIRKTPQAQMWNRDENFPNMGTDKLVFYNYDVHGKLHWQGVYSTALFLKSDDYKVLTF